MESSGEDFSLMVRFNGRIATDLSVFHANYSHRVVGRFGVVCDHCDGLAELPV